MVEARLAVGAGQPRAADRRRPRRRRQRHGPRRGSSQALDIYPTLVELCGLPAPPGLEGHSLAPLLADPHAAWDHPAFTVWSEDGRAPTGVAVRTERWRYAEFDDGAAAMLLDEQADPHEMKNLADDPAHAEMRSELSALVRAASSASRAIAVIRVNA